MTWWRSRFDAAELMSRICMQRQGLAQLNYTNNGEKNGSQGNSCCHLMKIKSPSEIQFSGCSARRKTQQYTRIASLFNAAMRPKIGFMKEIWCPGRDSNPHEVTR
jgi:hypothetical protein